MRSGLLTGKWCTEIRHENVENDEKIASKIFSKTRWDSSDINFEQRPRGNQSSKRSSSPRRHFPPCFDDDDDGGGVGEYASCKPFVQPSLKSHRLLL